MPTKIFVSHRFADKAIADVVRKHLGRWGFDEEQIYQASAPGLGPRPSEIITQEIEAALCDAKLVILVYTLSDYDWSFCTWECGLATDPRTHDTRTVVFQCSPFDVPKVFEGQLLVRVDYEGIKDFTIKLHRSEDFFPGEDAYRPGASDELLEDLSRNFLNDLVETIPPGPREQRFRWDSLTLELVDPRRLEAIDVDRERHDFLQNECMVVESFGEALKHFGYANLERDLSLAKLVERWKKGTEERANVPNEWVGELTTEMCRAIDNSPAKAEWKNLNSVYYADSWFYPVLNHVTVEPDRSMKFDVYLYRSLGN